MQLSLLLMSELETELEDFIQKTNMLADAVTQFKGAWRVKIGKKREFIKQKWETGMVLGGHRTPGLANLSGK